MIKSIKACRICKNTNLVKVLDLGDQYLTGVFPKSVNQKISCGSLQLLKCHDDSLSQNVCGLLQIAHDFDLNEMYGDNYGYRSGLNPSMVLHLNEKVKQILKIISLSDGDLVVDIGSNDSTTLQAYPNHKCELVGIDPTGKKFSKFYPPHIKLIPDFFSFKKFNEYLGKKKAKVITSFSMLYDLDKPLEFMEEVSKILAKDGIWIFEQSYMPTMLERNSYDTVCHEHKEYYGLNQIKWMTDKVGFKIINVEFNEINGGSFSVTVAHSSSKYPVSSSLQKLLDDELKKSLDNLDPYLNFANRVKNLRSDFKNFLNNALGEGKTVGALGASTKGNVILQYCGITNKEILFVGEVNSDKFNCFTPGTLLPIISEKLALEKNPDYLIVLPWHFKDFFMTNKKFQKSKLIFPLPTLGS
ncbi:class I SAM-dependent methyltransferase [Candidatus Pelagibacter bacterium nBUS_29]|uniref:class I SAM-dependent methyltransferase n=1 Tax=Candidatus Pelagibacter bacterium nBUS_29 TaxID=3374190 RepID=UPI003EB9E2E4